MHFPFSFSYVSSYEFMIEKERGFKHFQGVRWLVATEQPHSNHRVAKEKEEL